MLTASLSRKNRRQAFTLTEAAIVFGVVGIVMAAIWGAVSTVIRKNQINQMVENHGMLVQNILSLYKGRYSPNPDPNYTAFAIKAGLVPSVMVKDVLGTLIITTPWETPITLQRIGVTLLKVYYMNPPEDVCIELIARTTGPMHHPALIDLEVPGSAPNLNGMPPRDITPAIITCPGNVTFNYNVQG